MQLQMIHDLNNSCFERNTQLCKLIQGRSCEHDADMPVPDETMALVIFYLPQVRKAIVDVPAHVLAMHIAMLP